jgi:hypothetical protein
MPGCICILRCCSLAPCPRFTERRDCKSCNCPCKPIRQPEHLKLCKPCKLGQFRPFDCKNCKCKCLPLHLLIIPPLPQRPKCHPCPKSKSRFCIAFQDPSTCQCSLACCSLPSCPRGSYRDISKCTSCDCPCKNPKKLVRPIRPICKPCPKSTSPFCSSVQNPQNCSCSTKCCEMATCPPNTERRNCTSCNCPCQKIQGKKSGKGKVNEREIRRQPGQREEDALKNIANLFKNWFR